MALTKGFKKFVGLVVVVGAVAGSIVGYKMYAKAHPPAPVDPGIDVSSGTRLHNKKRRRPRNQSSKHRKRLLLRKMRLRRTAAWQLCSKLVRSNFR
jgi:hypothetical protein